MGWKTIFNKVNAWAQYNAVDLGTKPLKTVLINAMSETGGILEIHTGSVNGPIVAKVTIPKSTEFKQTKTSVVKPPKGIQNIFIVLKDKEVAVDWIQFN